MRQSKWSNLAILGGIILILVIALAVDSRRTGDERFVGADSAATSRIEQDHPDYQPWFEAVFSPGSTELESGLFALQAGLGGLFLGYCIGALASRRKDEALEAATAVPSTVSGSGSAGPGSGSAGPGSASASSTASERSSCDTA